MDTNRHSPYPSPPSSSNSPNVADTQVTPPNSSISRRATISAMNEASRDTQRHLQQTSAALDAAYNRIRQVRRSLLDLSESLPATLSQLRLHVPEGQVASDHDADAFSLPPEFQPPSAQELEEMYGARERAPWNRVLPGSHSGRSSSISSVTESLLRSADAQQRASSTLGLPGSVLPMHPVARAGPLSRPTPGDDGTTLLGRRVAARIAVVPTVADAASTTNQLIGDVGELYEGAFNSIASVTRSYEEELERVVRVMGERRRTSVAAPSRPSPRPTSVFAYPSQDPRQLSPRRSSEGTTHNSQASPGTSLNPQWDLGPGSVSNNPRQNSGPSERLSLLSNFSVQNLPTPSMSNMSSHPLIFDEPLSYVPSETSDPSWESRYHPTPESAFQGRNYVVHRTYNRNGEELVHNITVDWDDGDPMSWLMPSPNTSRRHRNRFSSHQNLDVLRTTDPIVPLPPPPLPPQDYTRTLTNSSDPPRRRGWGKFFLCTFNDDWAQPTLFSAPRPRWERDTL